MNVFDRLARLFSAADTRGKCKEIAAIELTKAAAEVEQQEVIELAQRLRGALEAYTAERAKE